MGYHIFSGNEFYLLLIYPLIGWGDIMRLTPKAEPAFTTQIGLGGFVDRTAGIVRQNDSSSPGNRMDKGCMIH
jgi:hypothetical protein